MRGKTFLMVATVLVLLCTAMIARANPRPVAERNAPVKTALKSSGDFGRELIAGVPATD